MLDTYLADRLADLDALTADLDPDLADVRAARRLVRRFRNNPRLMKAPLSMRHMLFDARSISTRLRRLRGPQGDHHA